MIFQLSAVNLINTIIIAAGIGVCGMCFLHITTSVNLPRSFRRHFQIIFLLIAFNMSTHLARQLMDGMPGDGIRIALHILPVFEILAACGVTYMISLLLLAVTNPDKTKKPLEIVLHILLILHAVLMISGSFTTYFYFIDADNLYRRGPGYLISNLIPLAMLVFDVVLLIRHGRKIDRRVRLAFWVYIIAPVIAIVIQSLSYGVQYIIFATIAATVFMYSVIIREQAEAYEKQTRSISRLQNGLILVMADLVESRDKCTGDHVRKTAEYVRIIMEQLRKDGAYADRLTDAFMEDVIRSAPLHDIGKIQVPDAILNKPGKLTDAEFEEIKAHAAAGRDIISSAIDMVAEESSGYLNEARSLAYCHHEKWNGTGYPQGLSGETIPLSARIMAVADVFDALVSKRSYKDGFPFEKAMEIIREGSGTHFDPIVVAAFMRAEDAVRAVVCTDSNAR